MVAAHRARDLALAQLGVGARAEAGTALGTVCAPASATGAATSASDTQPTQAA